MREKSILVFSIALNGYQWCYRHCLASHRAYANKHGYAYRAVTKPVLTSMGVECCWLKLTLMREALDAGYSTVIFVDADAKIQAIAPPISTIFKENATFYMAKGYTGRFNSGVLIARNCKNVKRWLDNIIASRANPPNVDNAVGWGENDHIIYFAKDQPFICELSIHWNNTYQGEIADFIRHFNHGPLRQARWVKLFHRALSRLTRAINILQKTLSPHTKKHNHLAVLTTNVVALYPDFRSPR